MRQLLVSIAVLFGLICGAARAAPVQSSFAADADSNTWDCRYLPDRGSCSSQGTFTPPNGTTTQWATGASSSASDIRGEAWSLAVADPGSYLPLLKTYASSNPNYVSPSGGTSMADANVWAVQGYRYTGTTAFTLTLTATLDTVISANAANFAGNHSLLAVSLFGTDNYTFNYDPATRTGSTCPITGPINPQFCGQGPAMYAHYHEFLEDTGTAVATLSYTLSPGQTFYVGAFIDANVCCGGSVDSSHTLTMLFNDASMLVDFPVALVPEPGGWMMLLVGVVMLGGWKGRRKA
ncbi:hypothetical protein GJV26_07645 [Massilia dura]|uniref:PEP-CTERM sorting domain-containing protein n=1 Tax=Pseudoduganella dura TaxID=321982 RepID=A0A6I3XFF2_9BURK|nr:PEP-CTERM sorting domain-containing protein [Pseudoduganella dura]MUI12341.1 hypothetical protein [Pseudoduganella dura]GGX99601.1 hypothetical protein GCM10007386_33030 [Pseudoduganella dura]